MGLAPAVLFAENVAPRHPDHARRWRRWTNNILLVVLGLWSGRLLMLSAAAGVNWLLGTEPIGLLTLAPLPLPVALGLSVLLIDLTEYLLHRVYHRVPLFWRLHLVHHSDTRVDITTALRSHPLMGLVSVPARLTVWLVLGVHPVAVVFYQLLSLGAHLFSHANWQLPPALERRLRRVLVTPDFHAVHHSSQRSETDSNYSVVLSCWDYLLGTAQVRDAAACHALVLGLEEFRDERELWLHRLLLQPWRR